MFPDGVETITMTREDYDRNVEQLLIDKCKTEIEIEELNKNATHLIELHKKTLEENKRLNNIINELEKWLYERSEYTNFGVVIDKLQELKGSDEE